MPEGPLGGPRPFINCNLHFIATIKGQLPTNESEIQIIERQIHNSIKTINIDSVGVSTSRDIGRVIITMSDNRVETGYDDRLKEICSEFIKGEVTETYWEAQE